MQDVSGKGKLHSMCKLGHKLTYQCSGGYPCTRCQKLQSWSHICVRVKFADGGCFGRGCILDGKDCQKHTNTSSGLYMKRYSILHNNVRSWLSPELRPLTDLSIGIGFKSKLMVKVNSFEPINKELLCHVNFRSITRGFLHTTPTQPFGLWSFEISSAALDAFLDGMVPEYLGMQAAKPGVPSWHSIFSTAYRLSLTSERDEVSFRFVRLDWH